MGDPKKNTAFTFDLCLVDTANRPQFKTNPTLATGDFKISIDNGAFTNLGTLPTVTPSGGRVVKVVLTSGEMNGDRIVIQAVDAAGSEWDDVIITIETTTVTVDDLVRSTTPANALTVDASGQVKLQNAQSIERNVALSFSFAMYSSSSNQPQSGLTVTAQTRVPGGSWGACSNSVIEPSGGAGAYDITFTAGELNAAVVQFKFSATGALTQIVTFTTVVR